MVVSALPNHHLCSGQRSSLSRECLYGVRIILKGAFWRSPDGRASCGIVSAFAILLWEIELSKWYCNKTDTAKLKFSSYLVHHFNTSHMASRSYGTWSRNDVGVLLCIPYMNSSANNVFSTCRDDSASNQLSKQDHSVVGDWQSILWEKTLSATEREMLNCL